MITPIRSFSRIYFLIVTVLLPFVPTSTIWANVQGGNVTYGQAEIRQTNPDRVDILQSSHKAVIQWDSFDIGLNETVHFEQPSAQSLALNRILDNNASTILGRLSATGRIFLINPNGILFGQNAQVDVSGLLATTIDISDEDFENGHYDFSILGSPDGYVVNQGAITAREGGMVAMVAPWVRNEGVISARLGQVSLTSAETFTLDMYGDGLVQIAVDDEPAAPLIDETGQPVTSLVENAGTIAAEGGRVFLTARSAGAFVDRAIDMSGIIEATSLTEQNGEIVLQGGDEGDVRVTGTLNASAGESGATGGIIKILGERVGLFQEAIVDVSGDNGGGQAYIGGAYQGGDALRAAEQTQVGQNAQIIADAGQTGDGGQVVVWADHTTHYYGNISSRGGEQSGDGGQVEVSGKENLTFLGSVDTSAPNGNVGELLLDPTDAVIVAVGDSETADLTAVDEFADPDVGGDGDTKISVDAINNAAADVTVQASQDLTVDTEIDIKNAGVDLSLIAKRHLNVNKEIFTDGGDLLLQSDEDDNGTGTTRLNIETAGSRIQTGGGMVTFSGPVELRREARIDSGGGDITFEDDITGDFQLYLRAATNGDVTLKGDTDVDTFTVEGFGKFVNEGTLQADNLYFADGMVSIDVGFGTAIADANGITSGEIVISPATSADPNIDLIGSFQTTGNFYAHDLGTVNLDLQINGDATVEAQKGTIEGTVYGSTSITDSDGGDDLINNVNGGGDDSDSNGSNDYSAVDIENIINQTGSRPFGTPAESTPGDPSADSQGGGQATEPSNNPDIRLLEDGRIGVYAQDGTLIGEISQGDSGTGLIATMQNAGYSPDQIAEVFQQAAESGVTCQDVSVNPDGIIGYTIGEMTVTLDADGNTIINNGSTEITYHSDGSWSKRDTETNVVTTTRSDGTTIVKHPSGETVTTAPDGTVTRIVPNAADGSVLTTVTQGNTTITTSTTTDETGNTRTETTTMVTHNDKSTSVTTRVNGQITATTETSADGRKVVVGKFDADGNLAETTTTTTAGEGADSVITTIHTVTGGDTTKTVKNGITMSTTVTVTKPDGTQTTTITDN
ncbi:MAG: filamentous hemagglutinin N-terminal domain-containing protein [Sedimentisphaerales bacterium]|nr:filamentous hemagglutinin N-terminal domain-containing protein [Sedimentisphaerales bacterium]